MISLSLIDISPGMVFWTGLAFIVLIIFLSKYAWKPILSAVKERENSIADAIDSADKVKKEMAQMQADNEKLLQQAREEKAAMLKEAKEVKEKIIAEAEGEARANAERITADAKSQIEHQKMAAMMDVKNQVGKLVLEVSEKVLRKEMDDKNAQMSYIDKLTDEIKLN